MKYLSMNRIEIDGEIIKTGRQPDVIAFCGFKDAAEVQRVAAKFSTGIPYMRIDDVAEWFKSH